MRATAEAADDLAVMRDAIDQFHSDRGRYPGDLGELAREKYVRKIPVDPITKSAETWVIVANDSSDMPGVYDVRSGAKGTNSDGIPYEEL